eukprot:2612140-Rhodomonas_salina.1
MAGGFHVSSEIRAPSPPAEELRLGNLGKVVKEVAEVRVGSFPGMCTKILFAHLKTVCVWPKSRFRMCLKVRTKLAHAHAQLEKAFVRAKFDTSGQDTSWSAHSCPL